MTNNVIQKAEDRSVNGKQDTQPETANSNEIKVQIERQEDWRIEKVFGFIDRMAIDILKVKSRKWPRCPETLRYYRVSAGKAKEGRAGDDKIDSEKGRRI